MEAKDSADGRQRKKKEKKRGDRSDNFKHNKSDAVIRNPGRETAAI